uniref:HTTM domain-containing protein n=1 Tax=Roseihalotalea indica TaxID=2867963 RepID=A0AA49GQH4_9BACT|nr:HTTM domain-containing protein [Tunicatimonas sp. TK19036]
MSEYASVLTKPVAPPTEEVGTQPFAHWMHRYLHQRVSNAPLIIFRVLFGAMMAFSIIRFAANGWIEEFYIQPSFHFPYYGLEWIQALPAAGMYALFLLMFAASLGICLGFFYQISTVAFFLAFTYVELIDKTYYLNHYYFVSIIAFWLIWLPAHRRFSLDVLLKPALFSPTTPILHINVLRWQTGIVYCYAGLAKINSDWLLRAMPLRLWLPANGHLLGLGFLLKQSWVAYAFSWFGMLYDLSIPFFLSVRKTRTWAYLTVIVFHGLTAILFPIGIFPWVMIFTALIFFPAEQQEKWLSRIERWFGVPQKSTVSSYVNVSLNKLLFFGLLLATQLILPWRYSLYPGSVFWNEEGYRFSWRVMLMEKAGQVTFRVTDPETGHSLMVDNSVYLTPQQEKMMATQPDMLLQFAHHLDETYRKRGVDNPTVKADAFVTLNGRRSRRFVNPDVDLSEQPLNLKHREWILPYED